MASVSAHLGSKFEVRSVKLIGSLHSRQSRPDPRRDPAAEVDDALEAARAQEAGADRGPRAALALHDDGGVLRQVAIAVGEIAERDVARALDVAVLPLGRVPDIDQRDRAVAERLDEVARAPYRQ